MKITDLLSKESIELNGQVKTKKEALDAMVSLMEKRGNLSDVEEYRQAVYAREEEGTTGVGEGIAIPHGRCQSVTAPGLAAMVVPQGVDYEALDDEPVYLIFLIAAPNTKDNVHLDVLSSLSVLLMDEEFVKKLRKAQSKEEFLKIIEDTETAKAEAESKKEAEKARQEEQLQQQEPKDRKKMVLAVTACPTGIAHTYMAAESIEKKAAEKGIFVKVETRGSSGAKNVLTSQEIQEAEGIIVAADTNVPMDRFDGKRVIECPVADGISKSGELIDRILAGDAPVYHGGTEGGSEMRSSSSKDGAGHQIYKHLMNGVSHMLPFVVGGGILIAIAFLIDGMSVDVNSLSEEMRSQFGNITPLADMFKTIGNTAFSFMLPILAAFIAQSIADRPGLVAGFVGGSLAASGTSGFLGALAAGFIAGYLVEGLKKVFAGIPKSLDGIKPMLLYPVLGTLLMGIIMMYIIEPPIGALNTMLNNSLASMGEGSAIILGIVVAAMMAIDMGGPFNKAAYLFGTASIAAGNYGIMAAVMIGGMVPPCAIALATLLFKNKFTEEERKSGPTNFVMGLSFITEGAIPFAAADPLRVIPSCMAGSGLAGALSMAFGCTLMAPHGGIFVFPVVGNALLYLAALAAGTVLGAVLLGILKKKVN